MQLRTYARLVAMVSVVASVVEALGWLALGKGAALIYLFAAGVFAYAGSQQADAGFARAVVGNFGAFYLASGLVFALVFAVVQFPFGGGAYVEAFGIATVSGVSAVCARVLPCDDDPPEGQEGTPRQD